jgi:membrane protein DedA with SNARE-associated domain
VQAVLDALDGFGGVYLAVFVLAILSGVIPITNAELAMGVLGAGSSYDWPKLVLLAAIAALGQSVTHASLFFTARGLAKAGAKRRPKLEAKIAKAHELAERWHKSEILLMVLGATVGIPPQVLVALVAGIIGIRFRIFAAIDILGRTARFTTIVLAAHYFAS